MWNRSSIRALALVVDAKAFQTHAMTCPPAGAPCMSLDRVAGEIPR
jgi:hypothetical protein